VQECNAAIRNKEKTMERIIAGRFPIKESADAVAALIAQHTDPADICVFHNNPPGQHDMTEVGGDTTVDAGAEGAGQSSAGAASATGLAAGVIGALGGPVAAGIAAATGAYVGSFAGALNGLGNKEDQPAPRPAGIILAVRITDPAHEDFVIEALRNGEAKDIERAEGEWHDGDWVDFNPVVPPRLVDRVPY
jgi:hypothetical protein